MKFETKAIRIQSDQTSHREHSTPIFPTSSFTFESAEHMAETFADQRAGNIYSRFTNPSVREFEMKMSALENVQDAFATASGMSAVFASFMAFLKSGDHVLATRAIFGSTSNIIQDSLPKWNITFDWLPEGGRENWEKVVKPTTRILYLETPSNPGLEIFDIEEVSKFTKAHNILLIVDNCFATPYLQQPCKWGADLSVHSATKYIDGQGRVLGGAVCGRKELITEVKKFCRRTGPALSPFNAWVLSKSLETLPVRMDRHCSNALSLARFLTNHEKVEWVRYPMLESHSGFQIAQKQMRAGGGIVTFGIKGDLKDGRAFINGAKMMSITANLGDTRTIVTHPASTTHAKISKEDKLAVGITDQLIRISAGLEHIDDIIADVDQSLNQI